MRLAAAALFGLVALGGCVSSAGEPPAWFSERQAEELDDYPSLQDVPRGHDANVDAAHWAAVERDVIAAGQAVKNHPRAAPASEANVQPGEFVTEAQEDLEEARQAHPD
jgi:hypothetical protein